MNEIINKSEETSQTTNEIIYATASVITEKLNGKSKNHMRKRIHKQSRWKSNIEQEINNTRGVLSIIRW